MNPHNENDVDEEVFGFGELVLMLLFFAYSGWYFKPRGRRYY